MTTFSRSPLSFTTTVGGTTGPEFAFWQYGSALILMAFSGAALPSRVTLPATEPVVEASTVFPAGAVGAAGCSVVVLSLLPHPVMAMAIRVARARCENLLLMLENSSLAELRILTRSSTEGARFLVRYERQSQRCPAESGRYKCKDYLPFAASFSH